MKLSVSNIAWSAEHDQDMYLFLRRAGFQGLEIAPTRIYPDNPYRHIDEVRKFAVTLREKYELSISSMQSIWHGRSESIFGADDDREALIGYTKLAIELAGAIGCGNLVFGCPKNRNMPDNLGSLRAKETALEFFAQIAEYAVANHTVIALEANPPIYGTNFINTTTEAIELCRELNAEGLKVNIDTGTMIYYNESASLVADNLDIINHIHISEPKLAPIVYRELHHAIMSLSFDRYVSIEMRSTDSLDQVKRAICYLSELSGMNRK
jgi:sugar phosphate isomerase/epimerase